MYDFDVHLLQYAIRTAERRSRERRRQYGVYLDARHGLFLSEEYTPLTDKDRLLAVTLKRIYEGKQ